MTGREVNAKVTGREVNANVQPRMARDVKSDNARLYRSSPKVGERTKEGRVFKAYDRNGDGAVNLEEWYAMKEGLGEGDTERRKLEALRFKQADPKPDGKMTAQEFLYWYTKGRFRNTREGEAAGSRERDSDKSRERDREPRRETREGERAKSSPGDREE